MPTTGENLFQVKQLELGFVSSRNNRHGIELSIIHKSAQYIIHTLFYYLCNMTKTTAEGIKMKSSFTKEDLKDVNHIGFAAGIAPNLRGPYSTMYLS
ncbi:MAG: hypothetical protein ACI8ZX_002518, partial [Planctomycetota bacterium]